MHQPSPGCDNQIVIFKAHDVSMNNAFFSDLLTSIADRGRALLGYGEPVTSVVGDATSLIALCNTLLSGRGEASGTALAREVLDLYARLDGGARLKFFEALAHEFGPDRKKLDEAIAAFQANPQDSQASSLHFLSEPRRQDLFRRLNRAPGGTQALVAMRADLLDLLRDNPALQLVDRDFSHLLASWFNRGFLVLRRIDWATPAIVLEKIIRYEAVHEIRGWDDLRRRIDPVDRRCYAFFHPALVDEPLIFVEVALTAQIPVAIAPLLAQDRQPVPLSEARTAVFYSISNCQRGLAGVSFGNFLIKQVVEDLRREGIRLETFVTLSPVPDFGRWLKRDGQALLAEDEKQALAVLETPDWASGPEAAGLRKILEPLAAHYFLKARNSQDRPVDAVARFHLGNGARLERINWLGDVSPKALAQSAGLMVNYLYDLEHIEENHEAFVNKGKVVASSGVQKMLKKEAKKDSRTLFSVF